MLLTMARVPVGVAGVVQLPGEVVPTRDITLRQPLGERTLA
jgi:hypothetical protein